MLISLKTEYAIKALIYLAQNQGHISRLPAIAKAQGIPAKFLERILNDLRKAKLVSSERGKNGGYFLGESEDKITLLDVVEVLEGKLSISSQNRRPLSGRKTADRIIARVYQQIQGRLEHDLRQITLGQLVGEAGRIENNFSYMI